MAHATPLAIRGLNKRYEVKGQALPVLQAIGITVSLGVVSNFVLALLLTRERARS